MLTEKLLESRPCVNEEGTSGRLFVEDTLGPFGSMTTSEKEQDTEDLVLVTSKLLHRQPDIERIGTEKSLLCLSITTEVWETWI